jgi:hypothetical protein
LVWSVWPSKSETSLADLAGEQASHSKRYNELGDTIKNDMLQQADLLKGKAGDAHQALMGKMRDHAYAAADHFDTKVTTANGYKSVIHGLKTTLTQIADAAEKDWEESGAGHAGLTQVAAANAVVAKYGPEVQSAVDQAWADFEATPDPSDPPPPPVNGDHPAQAEPYRTRKDDSNQRDRTVQAVDNTTGGGSDSAPSMDGADTGAQGGTPLGTAATDSAPPSMDGADTGAQGGTPLGTAAADGAPPSMDNPAASGAPVAPSTPGRAPGGRPGGMPATGLGGGGMPGGGSGGMQAPSLPGSLSGATSPSSSLPASSLPGSPGSSLPASSLPQPSSSGGLATPLSNAGNSFQSGFASGLGSSGATPPPLPPVQQPTVGAPAQSAAGGVPVAPASQGGVPGYGPGSSAGAAGAAPSSGGGSGGMMPPPMAGAAPLAPYTPASGGHVPPPPAGPGPTSAASGGPPGGSSASAGAPSQQQPGGGGAPLVAGTSGGAVAGGLPERDVNPDLIAAKRVLDGLVRGTNAATDPMPLTWAVGVLRTAMGSQTVVASSMGGGGYVPAAVFVPAGVRVAAVDPALPMGWAAMFMGWQSPADIVAAHCDKVAERLAGVELSALVTTDVYGKRPGGVTDFLAVATKDILSAPGSAPVFDGAHQHRLVTIDPALAQKVAMLDRGGDVGTELASQVSAAVIRAAQQQTTPTGQALVNEFDVNTLVAVGDGRAVDWEEHFRHVLGRDNHAVVLPESQARPLDLDDSPTSVNARALYYGYYRMGRIVELVRCWQHRPVSVLDVVYCGLTAGCGPAVAAVIAEWEQRGVTPLNVG